MVEQSGQCARALNAAAGKSTHLDDGEADIVVDGFCGGVDEVGPIEGEGFGRVGGLSVLGAGEVADDSLLHGHHHLKRRGKRASRLGKANHN